MYTCNRCVTIKYTLMYVHVYLYVCMCVCRCMCESWWLQINYYIDIDIAASTLYPTSVTIAFDWQSCLAPSIWALRAARMSTDQHTTDIWIASVTELISVGKIMRSVRHVTRSPPITSNNTYIAIIMYMYIEITTSLVSVCLCYKYTLLYKVDSSSIFKNPCNHVIQSNGHI